MIGMKSKSALGRFIERQSDASNFREDNKVGHCRNQWSEKQSLTVIRDTNQRMDFDV